MNPNEEKIRQFLKKSAQVDANRQPTLVEKQEFVRRKLFAEQTHAHQFQKKTVSEYIQAAIGKGFGFFRSPRYKAFMRDTFPFLAFFSFSTFLLCKMELQFDKINQSVFRVKTIKQQEIEKENDYIQKALRGEKFSAQENQITDVPDRRNKYKFEEVESDDSVEFDTRDDFLDGLRKDYNQGMEISEEYRDQVFEFANREKKQIGFGIGLSKEEVSDDSQGDEKIIEKNQPQQKKPQQQRKIRQQQRPQHNRNDDLGYDGFGPSTEN